MKNKFWLIILFAMLGLASFNVFAQTQNVKANAERISGDTFPYSAKTAKGAKIYSYKKVSPAILKAIDNGLDTLFAIARKHNYFSHLNYSDYAVYIARPDRQKNAAGNYSPAIAVAPNQYAGSMYDQGGFIYVAGMVIADDPSAFLIVDYNDKNLSQTSDIVRYEGEHIILYFNDRRLFNQTVDHSKGGGHPILQ